LSAHNTTFPTDFVTELKDLHPLSIKSYNNDIKDVHFRSI